MTRFPVVIEQRFTYDARGRTVRSVVVRDGQQQQVRAECWKSRPSFKAFRSFHPILGFGELSF